MTKKAESSESESPQPGYIAPDLWPLAVPIDSVVMDADNAMSHPDENIEAIKRSLEKFKQRKPIVVNRNGNVIEAGNGTWRAAKALGWGLIAAVFVEDDPGTAVGFSIADNRTAQLAFWDYETLRDVVERELTDPTEVPGVDDAFWAEVLDGAAISEQLDGDMAGGGNGKSGLTDDKKKQVRPVLWVDDLEAFEDAIKATGLMNRGQAVIEICTFYLGHCEKGQLYATTKGAIAPQDAEGA